MSKPLSSRHASIGISVPESANDWTTYSGNWTIVRTAVLARLDVLVDRRVVARLVLEIDVHPILAGVVLVGQRDQRRLEFVRHPVPERDLHRAGRIVERAGRARAGRRVATRSWSARSWPASVSAVDPVESVGVEPPGDPLWTVDGGAVDATVSGSSRPACNADLPDPQAAATTAPTAIIATARPTRPRAIIP